MLAVDPLLAWEPWRWPVADDWQPIVERFLQSPQGRQLAAFVQGRLAAGATVYPATPFLALAATPLAKVRVVILGQDPYHGPGQAHGLAFSVTQGIRPPPSLRNIFAEIDHGDVAAATRGGSVIRRSGNLSRWAEQGVLLLNTSLTVENGLPGSHAGRGWETLADQLLQAVAQRSSPVVFMLWGAHAQARKPLIEAARSGGNCLVLCANHPSPLSARRPPVPFIGCGHFQRANAFLGRHQSAAVDWAA